MRIAIPTLTTFSRLRLVKYVYYKDSDEVIQLVIFNTQEIAYCCFERNAYYGSEFNYTLHYYTEVNGLP